MLFGINMKFITEKICIDFIKEEFPKFIPYWEDYIRKEGQNDSINIKLIPFEKYTIQVIKSNDTVEIKKIFAFIEFLLREGNESVQTAICTGYLENLMSKDPDEIQFSTFANYMGEDAIGYCKGVDASNGTRTKGLW